MISEILEIFKEELVEKAIPYKETSNELIVRCPYCLKEGKEKLKLYISKDKGLYNCFRCGKKGHIFNVKLFYELGVYRTIDYLNQNADLESLIKNQFDKQKLIDELENLRKNKDVIKRSIEKLKQSRIEYYENNCFNVIGNRNYIQRKALNYLLKRNIFPYELDLMNINYYICENTELQYRITFPTYFYSSYESRTFINQTIRYLKKSTSLPDFVFFNIHNLRHLSFDKIPSNGLEHDFIFITEGVFDALRLASYGYPSISLAGKSNIYRVLKFLVYLKELYNITARRIIFIFDNDVSSDEIQNFHSYYLFELKEIFNFNIDTFKLTDYKDMNEIPDDKIEEYISRLIK